MGKRRRCENELVWPQTFRPLRAGHFQTKSVRVALDFRDAGHAAQCIAQRSCQRANQRFVSVAETVQARSTPLLNSWLVFRQPKAPANYATAQFVCLINLRKRGAQAKKLRIARIDSGYEWSHHAVQKLLRKFCQYKYLNGFVGLGRF